MMRYLILIALVTVSVLSTAFAAAERDFFLDTCLRIAEARDPKLKVGHMSIDLAGRKVLRSGRSFFPAAQLQRTIARGKTAEVTTSSGTIVGEEYQSEQIGIRLAQPIFAGGRLVSVYKYDSLSREVARLQYTKMREELFYRVKSAYYELMASRAEAAKLKDAYTEIQRLGKKSEVEFAAKAISGLDLLEAQVFLEKVKNMYENAELNENLAEEKLMALSNINSLSEIIYEMPASIPQPQEVSFTFKECFGFAMTNNLDIKISETYIRMNQIKKNIDIARVLPAVTLEGFLGKSGDAFVSEPLQLASLWSASAKLSWGIWGNSFEATQTQEKTQPSEVLDASTKVDNNTLDMKLSLMDDMNYYVESEENEVNFRQSQAENQEAITKTRLDLNKFYNDYLISLGAAKNALQEMDLKERKLTVLRKRNELYEVTTIEVMDGVFRLAESVTAYSKALSSNYIAVADIERMTLVSMR